MCGFTPNLKTLEVGKVGDRETSREAVSGSSAPGDRGGMYERLVAGVSDNPVDGLCAGSAKGHTLNTP